MAVLMVQACKCDQCGHIWLADNPKRCSKCKSSRWNLSFEDQAIEMARKRGAVAVQINDRVIRVPDLPMATIPKAENVQFVTGLTTVERPGQRKVCDFCGSLIGHQKWCKRK